MPELPEVETMVRGIRPFVQGRRIVAAKKCRCACKPLQTEPSWRSIAARLRGATVTAVRRLAKRIVLDLSSGEMLAVEPRMTGLMLLADPPDREHLRFEWRFAGDAEFNALWFWDRRGLGTVRLYRPGDIERELGPHKLGPDALAMTAADWRERLTGTQRAIKVALLDQKLVAGIGNLYAGEILHEAGIHPEQRSDALTSSQLLRLDAAVRSVLNEAIEYEGSTLGDQTYRNALNRNGRYQSRLRVYGRSGQPCATCGRENVERIVQAQRSTFFCAVCQPLSDGA
ncbi:MAG: bifunctional DNA-formamidopyrimidine glycosylase/DNA-(apurinic or apyrimidinic site) lyase [Planctomycetaceae bacterium]